MVEVEPAQTHEWRRDFQKDKHGANRHGEALLPESEVVVCKGDQVVQQCLLVNRGLNATQDNQVEGVHEQVTGREVTRPYVAVAWHLSTLLVIEECLPVPTSPEHAVERKSCR